MSLTKIVDGIEVEMSAEEEAAIRAEWAANEAQANGPEAVQAMVEAAVQARLDAFAQTRGYDGILSACTYAASTVPRFQAEGQCCVNARDAHWAACYQIMSDVLAGNRPLPTLEEVIGEMPALEWPQ